MKSIPGDDGTSALDISGGKLRPLGPEEQSLLRRCAEALVLKEAGDYEAARRTLSARWPPGEERPRTQGLRAFVAAELLLRAGAVIACFASAKQTKGALALAEELLAESVRLFGQEGQKIKAAEALAELAYCRWRGGDFEGARRRLGQALAAMGNGDEAAGVRLVALLRAAVVDLDSGQPAEAFNVLTKAASLFLSSNSETLKGRYRVNLGVVYKELAQAMDQRNFLTLAVSELRAALYHLNQAGARRLIAHAENNLGFSLFLLGEFEEAAERLGRARKLFTKLGDAGHAAQVMETQAQLLLAQGLCEEAARLAGEAVRVLEAGVRPALLAEALTTQGKALARVGRSDEARAAFDRAAEVAEEAGAWESAGLAALSELEELGDRLGFVVTRGLCERASALLDGPHRRGTWLRLQKAWGMVIAATHGWDFSAARPDEGAVSEAVSLRAALKRLSGCQSPLLITGERVNDIHLLARIAHERSGRAGNPFVVVDCAALDDALPSREFLGGDARRAAGGTLFIYNVQELSRADQGWLLRLIRDGVVTYGRKRRRCALVDVRVVAGIPSDMWGERRNLSPTLFERLDGRHPLHTPSAEALEEQRVVEGCRAKEEVRRCYTKGTKMPQAAVHVLRAPVTSVVRMLARHHSRTPAAAGAQGQTERAPQGALASPSLARAAAFVGECASFTKAVRLFKKELIRDALEAADGSVTKAARDLGIPRQTLQNMLETKYKELQQARTPPVKRSRRAAPTRPR